MGVTRRNAPPARSAFINKTRKLKTDWSEVFAKRLDDDLFVAAACSEIPITQQKKMTRTNLVWLGYELIVESPKLAEKYNVGKRI